MENYIVELSRLFDFTWNWSLDVWHSILIETFVVQCLSLCFIAFEMVKKKIYWNFRGFIRFYGNWNGISIYPIVEYAKSNFVQFNRKGLFFFLFVKLFFKALKIFLFWIILREKQPNYSQLYPFLTLLDEIRNCQRVFWNFLEISFYLSTPFSLLLRFRRFVCGRNETRIITAYAFSFISIYKPENLI